MNGPNGIVFNGDCLTVALVVDAVIQVISAYGKIGAHGDRPRTRWGADDIALRSADVHIAVLDKYPVETLPVATLVKKAAHADVPDDIALYTAGPGIAGANENAHKNNDVRRVRKRQRGACRVGGRAADEIVVDGKSADASCVSAIVYFDRPEVHRTC